MAAIKKFLLTIKTLYTHSGDNNDTKDVVKTNLNTASFSYELWFGVFFQETQITEIGPLLSI